MEKYSIKIKGLRAAARATHAADGAYGTTKVGIFLNTKSGEVSTYESVCGAYPATLDDGNIRVCYTDEPMTMGEIKGRALHAYAGWVNEQDAIAAEGARK